MTTVVRPSMRCVNASCTSVSLSESSERRLVEQEQRRLAQHRARNGDALALAARERHAALANLRIVALRQALDELGGVRSLGSRARSRRRMLPAGRRRMFSRHGPAAKIAVSWRNQRDVPAQVGWIGIGNAHSRRTRSRRERIIEPQNEMEDRALLTGPRGPTIATFSPGRTLNERLSSTVVSGRAG
jgi:hypothetical protein